eukprot:gene33657-40719_t
MSHFEMMGVGESKADAEETPLDTYYVNTLQDWIALYKLDESPAIMNLLTEVLGVVDMDKLMYNDIELLEVARKALSPAELELYVRAGMCTAAFDAFQSSEAQMWLENMRAEARDAAKRALLDLAGRAQQKAIQDQMIRVRKDATVDIAFVLDCTGSMKKKMKGIQKDVMKYVDKVKALHGAAHVRLAFVGFKDYGCKGPQILVLDFTEDFEAFTNMVGGVECGGGMDDGAEDVLGGLKAASELSWDATHRFMYLVTDNPCHGFIYHHDFVSGHEKGPRDRFPLIEQEPLQLRAEDILQAVYDKKVAFSFCKITDFTDIMIAKFNQIFRSIAEKARRERDEASSASSSSSQATDSESAVAAPSISGDYIKMLQVKDVNLINIIANTTLFSLSSSWASSAYTENGENVKTRTYLVDPEVPLEWPEEDIEAIEYPLVIPDAIPVIVDAINSNKPLSCVENAPSDDRFTLKLHPFPFGIGAMKASFYGMLTNLSDPETSSLYVFKESKVEHASKLKRSNHEKFLQCHSVSAFFADLFTIQKPKRYPGIRFADASLMELTSESNMDTAEIFMIKEELIEAPYEKYNNNTGYVAPCPTITNHTDHSVVQAFSHWTHEITNGTLIIVDCQGGYDKKSNCFILTDPGIHCANPLLFGRTNMQKLGMNNFFKSHKCNSCCKKMGLRHPNGP